MVEQNDKPQLILLHAERITHDFSCKKYAFDKLQAVCLGAKLTGAKFSFYRILLLQSHLKLPSLSVVHGIFFSCRCSIQAEVPQDTSCRPSPFNICLIIFHPYTCHCHKSLNFFNVTNFYSDTIVSVRQGSEGMAVVNQYNPNGLSERGSNKEKLMFVITISLLF